MPNPTVTRKPPTPAQLYELRKEGYCTDLEIVAKDGAILRAHRVILGANSLLFKKEIEDSGRLEWPHFTEEYVDSC